MNRLGSGSFSTVYRSLLDGEVVAVKKTIEAGRFGLRFLMEAYILNCVKHPYLSRAIRTFIDKNGVFYFVQEIADSDLSSYKREVYPLLYKKWCLQILLAVHELHQLGIVHGDIKLCNVLLYGQDVRLGDFSLSMYTGGEPIYVSAYTSTHRAPEVSAGKGWSYPADIWSLAYTFCELRRMTTNTDIQFVDLITLMTKSHPKLRPSTTQLLSHPFFSDFTYPLSETPPLSLNLQGVDSKKIRDAIKSKLTGTYLKCTFNNSDLQREIEAVSKIRFRFLV